MREKRNKRKIRKRKTGRKKLKKKKERRVRNVPLLLPFSVFFSLRAQKATFFFL